MFILSSQYAYEVDTAANVTRSLQRLEESKSAPILTMSCPEPANRDSYMTGEKGQLPRTIFCSQTETVKLQSQLSIKSQTWTCSR